ncbi:MAG: LuxR C-terminal-related transcriptional regulator [Pseudomonadota bacterium]
MNLEQKASSKPNLDVADLLAGRFPGHTMQRMRTPDGRYRYAYVSPGVEASFGLNPTELMRAKAVDHSWLHPDDRSRFVHELERSASDLTPLDTEVRVETPNGRYRWVRSLGHPRREPDGSVIWDGVALDVTDRREAHEALERTLSQARADETSEGRFSYIAARDVHERLAHLREAVTVLSSQGNSAAIAPEIAAVKERFAEFERALSAARDLVTTGADSDSSAALSCGDPKPEIRLTKRQLEIMTLVSAGRSNRAIAETLGITEGTVKLHISTILKRLGARNRTEAAKLWECSR